MTARPHPEPTAAPPVSVIIAVRNEERDLGACLDRLLGQDYPGDLEVVMAVAPSDDGTAEVARERSLQDPRLTVVDNPAGFTPHGLNRAIAAARHDVLVRADGHALIPDDYVSSVVRVLVETGADNVGGRMVPFGDSPPTRAIAHAMGSRFGLGGGAFHVGGEPGPQATVYLGTFRRSALDAVGGYDEYFVRAQDWELNHRLRASGHEVWFDPSIAVRYHPRPSWRAFARQQYRTGGWRRRVIERHPDSASARYLLPPLVVLLIGLGLVAAVGAAVGSPWLLLGLAVPVGYLTAVAVIGLVECREPWPVRIRVPVAMAIMHLTWGSGFWRRAR